MNISFISQNSPALKRRNYVQKATSRTQYWFNFYSKKLKKLVQRYDENICLVLNGSDESDDAYVLPFKSFKDFFSPDYLDDHDRWSGYVAGDQIKLCLNGKVKTAAAGTFHNAFYLLTPSLA
jgi:hypothetical protein